MKKIDRAYSVLNIVRVKTQKMTYLVHESKELHNPTREIRSHCSMFNNIDAVDYLKIEGFVEQIIFNNIGK